MAKILQLVPRPAPAPLDPAAMAAYEAVAMTGRMARTALGAYLAAADNPGPEAEALADIAARILGLYGWAQSVWIDARDLALWSSAR